MFFRTGAVRRLRLANNGVMHCMCAALVLFKAQTLRAFPCISREYTPFLGSLIPRIYKTVVIYLQNYDLTETS